MLPILAALSLTAGAAQIAGPPPGSGSVQTDPFRPDTVLTPPAGPRIVLLGAPSGGVAALRLAVPLTESPAEAGVGMILRDLALARMESLARPVGARVSATRTPWGLAYSVEGAVADFEYLAYLLRQAVGEPDLADVPFTDARQNLERVLAETREAPGPHVAARLRREVVPQFPPVIGTPGSFLLHGPARVREVWLRSHRAPAMTLVASAGVAPEVVLAATRGLGVPGGDPPPPVDAPAPPDPRSQDLQTLRTWFGAAWTGGTPEQPEGPVATLLVADALRARTEGFESGVELWELPDRWAIAAMGAAYARDVTRMRRAVSGAVAAARADLTDEAVRGVVARVRRDLLLRARTPGGLVGVVGRAMEASGDPQAAARYAAALSRIDRQAMDAFLAALDQRGPATVEVRP